ncbi:MAG: F0F1 ATP synthase subunit B [Methyloligellaceae bacterium]
MLKDPSFWVAISFFGFIGLLMYYKVPQKAGEALDKRADKIRDELEEARKLREEAQAILADYQRKQKEAEESAKEIIALAKQEAETYATETRQALAESLERRTRIAEDKIGRAEAQAMDEVRAAAVDVAIAAADKLIADNLTDSTSGQMIDRTIKELQSKLN